MRRRAASGARADDPAAGAGSALKMATRWRVPPLWFGRTVAVMASGPSMSQQAADAVGRAGIGSIVVNETWRLAPWADLLFAADADFWRHRPDARSFEGLKVTASSSCEFSEVLLLEPRVGARAGFDGDTARIRTGANSGYGAVHIAAQGGARRILLCGFDMRGGHPSHWHGQHAPPLRNGKPSKYERWRSMFPSLVAPLGRLGCEVVNCTPGSALDCFRRADLADELRRATECDAPRS